MYVKDEAELDQLLLTSALDNAALHVNPEAPPLSGSALEMLARQYMEVKAIIGRWSRRYDRRLLEQLLAMRPVGEQQVRGHGLARGLGQGTRGPAQCRRQPRAQLQARRAPERGG